MKHRICSHNAAIGCGLRCTEYRPIWKASKPESVSVDGKRAFQTTSQPSPKRTIDHSIASYLTNLESCIDITQSDGKQTSPALSSQDEGMAHFTPQLVTTREHVVSEELKSILSVSFRFHDDGQCNIDTTHKNFASKAQESNAGGNFAEISLPCLSIPDLVPDGKLHTLKNTTLDLTVSRCINMAFEVVETEKRFNESQADYLTLRAMHHDNQGDLVKTQTSASEEECVDYEANLPYLHHESNDLASGSSDLVPNIPKSFGTLTQATPSWYSNVSTNVSNNFPIMHCFESHNKSLSAHQYASGTQKSSPAIPRS